MNRFRYHPAILARYPDLATAVISIRGVDNTGQPPALAADVAAEIDAARQRLAETPAAELASISAWRKAFSSFGTKPTQYRNAAEALLRRVGNGNDLPTLNPLADIANLVSIRFAVPVAVLDLDGLAGELTVRFADGTERFDGLGTEEATTTEPGEVIFIDDAGTVHARRWCWRQSRAAATTPSTRNAVGVIEAHHPNAAETVRDAATTFAEHVRRHLPEATITIELGPSGA